MIQRSGFEWLFRLAVEPRRLWRRYLTNNPRLHSGGRQPVAGIRHYPLDGLESEHDGTQVGLRSWANADLRDRRYRIDSR